MDSEIPSSIEEILRELIDSDQPLMSARLSDLSNLSPDEMGLFSQFWIGVVPGRKLKIISRLVELAEDNVELDFSDIFKFCMDDRDDAVRAKAVEGLWENEEPGLIRLLTGMLEHDESEAVQVAAAMALGNFALLGEHKKLRQEHVEAIRTVLLDTIRDPARSIEVRRRALESVSSFSFPEVKETIQAAYRSDEPVLKVSALFAMGRSCDSSWLPVLMKELSSADAEIRYEAAGALGELEEEDAVPMLVKLLDDPDIDVRLVAIRAMGNIGGNEAKEALKLCLESTSEAIRDSAGHALQQIAAFEDPLSFKM